MLDAVRPWGTQVRAYRSREITAKVCDQHWEVQGYWELRTRIFVHEQRLFERSDCDEHDPVARPIVALSTAAGMTLEVVGIVRIYPMRDDVWYGGRLGVCRAYRRHGVVGSKLIRRAVGTAAGLGCRQFFATVQAANVRYFERHCFDVVQPIDVCGQPHALMQARVAEFEPLHCPGVAA